MHSKIEKTHHRIESFIAGLGAFIGLSLIGIIAETSGTLMVIAPFGATAVLLFSAPNSPFSKPLNIFGGYFISTLLGIAVLHYTSGNWLSIGIGLGITIALMQFFRVVHPPAGANFLIVTQGHLSFFLIWPLFVGLILLIVVGLGLQKVMSRIR